MNCRQVEELLERLSSGNMSREEAHAAHKHLASCDVCLPGLTPAQLVEILPALDETIEPSGDFSPRFYAKLGLRTKPWWKRMADRSLIRPLVAAGAMAAIVLVGIFAVRYPDVRQDGMAYLSDFRIAENLPLLEDMAVVSNLDLLENFDTIEDLPHLMRNGAVP